MNHRERVLGAINHQETDRVPRDFGASRDTSIVKEGYFRLKKYLGIEIEESVSLCDRMMQVVNLDEKVQAYFDVDLRGFMLGPPDKGGDVELEGNRYKDEWGVVRVNPPGSFYYDLVHCPLAGSITSSDILHHNWPDPHDPGRLRGLREKIQWVRDNTDYAIVFQVPSAFIHISQYVRGFEDWFMDCATNPNLMETLCDAILDVTSVMCENALKEVGDLIDIVFTTDDLGTQQAPIVSPAMYRRLFKPRHKRYFELIHSRTSAKLAFHACGSLWDILDDLVDAGVEILNPVQVSAAKMDTKKLKERYGDRLSFWGAIDTQHALPHGNTEEVKREVERRINDLAVDGGYILAAVHNIQPDVSPENIVTMYNHAREYGLPR